MNVASDAPRDVLTGLFRTAVAAADPHQVLAAHLPAARDRAATVIGAGKAAASMAAALEQAWRGPLTGTVVTPYRHAEPCRAITVVEAAHPVPDGQGEQFAGDVLRQVASLGPDDLLICLISGGGSSLLALPAPGLTLADKQAINRQLLRSGAPIDEMNCVRKHLSAIKGGRLALACPATETLTLAISDVPGDHPSVIASGPTVPDPTSCSDTLAIIERHDIDVPQRVLDWLLSPEAETAKADHPAFANKTYRLIATPDSALRAAERAASAAGLDVIYLGAEIEGEARAVAADHAARALQEHAAGRPCLLLSGGETTVTVKGSGRGGRNAEYLLALACALDGAPGIHALAADTDGIDGSEDNAGALLAPDSIARAASGGLDARALLDNNDGYGFFSALDDLLVTGPTRTNVNDFRAILVQP